VSEAPEERPPAPVRFHPAAREGHLHAPGRDTMPVRVFERDRDALMLVVLLDADTGEAPEAIDPLRLEYSSAQGLVRLEGRAEMEERDLIRFRPDGPAEVLQRREFVRIDAARPVLLTDAEDGTSISAHAIDLSGGGMLIQGREALEEGQQIRFTLDLGPGESPIAGTARVVRTKDTGQCGVVFEAISSTERQRLIHFIFDAQRVALARTRTPTRRRRRRA
jgi:hypothetical protein